MQECGIAHSKFLAAVALACGIGSVLSATEGCSASQAGSASDSPSNESGGAGFGGAALGTSGRLGSSASGGATPSGGVAGAGAGAGNLAGMGNVAGAVHVAGAGGVAGAGSTPAAGGVSGVGGIKGTSGAAGVLAAGGSGAQGAPYKGIANSPAAQIKALGASWCYNWGTTPKSTDCDDPYFVPMIWGSGNVASALKGVGKAGYKTVLGFNEPNKSDQANMTVADAIALWPDLTSDPNIRVGSPAVSDDGRAWLEDFMKQVKQKGLRVDFVAMHWYGWNKGSCVAGQLEGAVKWASQWGLPVWITEFGCMGSSNTDEKTVLDFFNSAIPMLAKHPLVERYAWYPWNTYNDVYAANAMTALGKAFAAAPPSHP